MLYSIENKLKTYWNNLLVETERAIKLLDIKLQNPFRTMAAKKLKQIHDSENLHKATEKRQLYIIKKLNQKLVTEKGKTIAIINSEEYLKKVHTFITDNNLHLIQKDPTSK
jgi:hypothetical protein